MGEELPSQLANVWKNGSRVVQTEQNTFGRSNGRMLTVQLTGYFVEDGEEVYLGIRQTYKGDADSQSLAPSRGPVRPVTICHEAEHVFQTGWFRWIGTFLNDSDELPISKFRTFYTSSFPHGLILGMTCLIYYSSHLIRFISSFFPHIGFTNRLIYCSGFQNAEALLDPSNPMCQAHLHLIRHSAPVIQAPPVLCWQISAGLISWGDERKKEIESCDVWR